MQTSKKILNSSNVSEIGYDAEKQVLTVHFKTGNIYEYYNVSSGLYISLSEASSAGKFLTENIKGKYQFKKII